MCFHDFRAPRRTEMHCADFTVAICHRSSSDTAGQTRGSETEMEHGRDDVRGRERAMATCPISLRAPGQLRTFSLGLMYAGASCPISLRAPGQLRTFSWGSYAQGPLALISLRAPGQLRTFSRGSCAQGPLALSPGALWGN